MQTIANIIRRFLRTVVFLIERKELFDGYPVCQRNDRCFPL